MKPEKKQTSNVILLLKLTGRDAARENHQVWPQSLKTFQPSRAAFIMYTAGRGGGIFLRGKIFQYPPTSYRIF